MKTPHCVTRCRTCGGDVPQYNVHGKYFSRTCDDCKRDARERFDARARIRQAIPAGLKRRLLADLPDACPTCSGAWDRYVHPPEVDHIVPVSRGGTNDETNLRVICRRCNRRKHNRPLLALVS